MESFSPSQPSRAHLMRIGYFDTPWNTTASPELFFQVLVVQTGTARFHQLVECLFQIHGLVNGFAVHQIDHHRQAGLRNGAAVAVPHQSLDGVRFVIGDFDMDGRLVARRSG